MEWFIDNLLNNTNFSFSRFNDGEVGGILNENFIASRGAQKISIELASKLKEGLEFKKDNYWVGIPCPECYPDMYKFANNLVGEYKYKTLAVELINKNYQRFISECVPLITKRKIYWLGSNDQNLSELEKFGFNIIKQYKLPIKDAFSRYNDIKDLYKDFKPNSIVILSLGPLERVLAKEWFEKKDNVTYLGLGSTFDPWTRGVKHSYHTGRLSPCKICN